MNIMQRKLLGAPPQVFTMQLAWQSDKASKRDIQDVTLGLRQVRCFAWLCSASTACYMPRHVQRSTQILCFACAVLLNSP